MARITVTLETPVKNALCRLAECEHRDTRQQAALLIRQSLEKLGLLQPLAPSTTEFPTEVVPDEPAA